MCQRNWARRPSPSLPRFRRSRGAPEVVRQSRRCPRQNKCDVTVYWTPEMYPLTAEEREKMGRKTWHRFDRRQDLETQCRPPRPVDFWLK